MSVEDHGAGRRGPSAPYGNRKFWDFFLRHLQGATTPDWNAIAATTEPAGVPAGRAVASPWGPQWNEVAASIEGR